MFTTVLSRLVKVTHNDCLLISCRFFSLQWMVYLLNGRCGLPFDYFIENFVLFHCMIYLLSGRCGFPSNFFINNAVLFSAVGIYTEWMMWIVFFLINNAVLYQWMVYVQNVWCGLPFDFFINHAVLLKWMVS